MFETLLQVLHGVETRDVIPCGGALLGGLAEEEAELLQALGENVFARHRGGIGSWGRGVSTEDHENAKGIIHVGGDSLTLVLQHAKPYSELISQDCLVRTGALFGSE